MPGTCGFAGNPPPAQYYYVTLPEDDLLTLFDENQDNPPVGEQVVSPLRSVTSIAIGETGTLVYYDQWEDGGYDADIANPGANVYNAATNPAGTQIWGDGDLANGCPPSISNTINPCAVAADDQLKAGNVIILDNEVVVSSGVYNVLDQFGTAAYNNNSGTNNWATNWTETGDDVTANYRDEFASRGLHLIPMVQLNWTSPWVEENDDGSATTGTIYINATSQHLRFREGSAMNDAIRRTANLSGYSSAVLSFNIDGFNIGTSDAIAVEISNNGGSTYTQLEQFNSDPGLVTRTYDITAYIASNTTVRFIIRVRWRLGLATGITG